MKTKVPDRLEDAMSYEIYPQGQVEITLPDGLISGRTETLFDQEQALVRSTAHWHLRLPGVSGGDYRL